MTATPAGNEQVLLEAFSPVRDPHERLALITDACAGPGLAEEDRVPENLVPGCVSRVWVVGCRTPAKLHLRWDAESALVRGLAGLVCQVYQDAAPEEIARYRSRILNLLGLDRQLSPTRLRGLAAIEVCIQQLASP